MREPLTFEGWMAVLASCDSTAFHLELRDDYAVVLDLYDNWLATGQFSTPPPQVPDLAIWYQLVRERVAVGCQFERVRVLAEPPTLYQRFEQELGRWNTEAGEVLRSIPLSKAEQVGLIPGAGPDDWWLVDDRFLIVFTFDDQGVMTAAELETDPITVRQAAGWWAVAVANSTLDSDGIGGETS